MHGCRRRGCCFVLAREGISVSMQSAYYAKELFNPPYTFQSRIIDTQSRMCSIIAGEFSTSHGSPHYQSAHPAYLVSSTTSHIARNGDKLTQPDAIRCLSQLCVLRLWIRKKSLLQISRKMITPTHLSYYLLLAPQASATDQIQGGNHITPGY